jgi:leucyl aminopeptidase
MDVRLRRGDLATRSAGAVAIGVIESGGALTGAARAVDRASGGAVSALLASGDFRGRFLETAVLYPRGRKPRRVIVVGLGSRAALDPQRVRMASAVVARRARDLGVGTLATAIHGAGAGAGGLDPARAAQSVAEGTVLGHYRHGAYKREPGPRALRAVDLVEHDATRVNTLGPDVARGVAWGEAVGLARDLANTPGADLTPERLATRAREIAAASGARVEVFGVPQLERLGMGALLAVGRGSVHPPRFIVLERGPAGKTRRTRRPPVVIVGKGITFDTGGISLKPRENMHKMKYDMSGAAAVLGAFAALPTLDPGLRVIGLIATAENMPGGRAYKPGDVLRTLDGTTIEVTNTDAEGRLVLADALGYARRLEPAAVVDLATLTGAMSIALGHHAAGLFTPDDALANEITAASAASGERVWRFPLWDEYRADLRSDTADFVNSSGAREGGSIVAAKFLEHFARGMRWAHLDIAPTAWSPVERPLETRGATGYGVRLLLEWLSRRASGPGAA